jgi:hypothetical protein
MGIQIRHNLSLILSVWMGGGGGRGGDVSDNVDSEEQGYYVLTMIL